MELIFLEVEVYPRTALPWVMQAMQALMMTHRPPQYKKPAASRPSLFRAPAPAAAVREKAQAGPGGGPRPVLWPASIFRIDTHLHTAQAAQAASVEKLLVGRRVSRAHALSR
jgi:hypothetical protein